MEILGHNHQVIHGSGARMDLLSNGQVDLVITSPPYFSRETSELLAAPRSQQHRHSEVIRSLYDFAFTNRPIFAECHRVLKDGHAFVIQTKDIRYGDIIIPLSDHHLSIAMSCGFNLISRFNWISHQSSFKRKPLVIRQKKVGQFRVETGETFLILTKGNSLKSRGILEDQNIDLSSLSLPLWRVPFKRRKYDHPYASPRPVIRNLITLLSHEGDLVVDPFSGYGTILEVAKSLKRSAIGWEIDKECVLQSQEILQ